MELKQKIEIELKRMIWIISTCIDSSTCIDKQWLHLKKGQAKKESDHIKTQIKTCEKKNAENPGHNFEIHAICYVQLFLI